jgi:hypothetical protein
MSDPTAPRPAAKPRSAGHAWWYNVLLGLACAIAGVMFYAILNHMEADGGTVRLNFLLVWLYKWLGKWGVFGVLEVAALLLVAMGVRQRGREKAKAKGVTIV